MASIQRYTVEGRTYWRIVESRRINGKPRAIPIVHLGTADKLLKRLSQQGVQELSVKSYDHGGIAALLEVANELNLCELINKHVSKHRRGVSAGEALLLIALNRVLDPCAKYSWSEWAETTSLFKFFPKLPPFKKLTSQFFWEHMQQITPECIAAIEDELVKETISRYNLPLDLIFYDTTNCYTYVSDEHAENTLFQYGHSKEQQYNRRLFGIALVVTRHGTVPLYHHIFPGNQHDSTQFPTVIKVLQERLERQGLTPQSITLIFDRGNLSQDNFALIDNTKLGFVTGLRLGDIPRELFELPLQHSKFLKRGEHKGLRYFVKEISLWGQTRKAIFYISDGAREYQTKQLNDQLNRKLAELAAWNNSLRNQSGTDNCPDAISIERKIERLRQGPYLKDILQISYNPALAKDQRLQFSVNEKAKTEVISKYFGKRCVVTSHLDWDAHQIIEAYFSQAHVERAFRASKDHHHIELRPQFHWTDQSITAHTFSCFIALLLSHVLLLKAKAVNPEIISTRQLLRELKTVRLAAVLNKKSKNSASAAWKLENLAANTSALFKTLAPSAQHMVT